MRTPSSHLWRLVPALFAVAFAFAVAGCAGGGSSSTIPNPGSNQVCDPDAAGIQLARPTPGFAQTSPNAVEIVANGNADQLGRFTSQFDLVLLDQFNAEIDTGFLSAVADPGGPHPYSSDFFYQGTANSALQSGRTYRVFLNAPNTNCTPGFVGQFST